MNRRNAFGILTFAAFGIALMSSGAIAQQKPLKDAITGAWTLASVFDQYENGKKHNPWGNGVKGSLMFDGAGRFSQIIIGEKQESMKSGDPRRPDALAISYFGSYTVNEADKTISVKLERASNSARDGADQKWTVTGTGDGLSLVGSPRKDPEGTFSPHLELKRAK